MTAAEAQSWIAVGALLASLLIGIATSVTSVRIAWIAKAVALSTLSYGFAGFLLLTTPKWTEVILKIGEFEAKITRLQKSLETVETNLIAEKAANANYASQIAALTSLQKASFKTAAEYVSSVEDVRAKVRWADAFLPLGASGYAVDATGTGSYSLAYSLGTTPEKLQSAFKEGGYTLLKNAGDKDLESVSPNELWLKPADR
jgi:hypothetical protein